ncbi:MAG: VOC family protein, partial [Alphaproteobacteria bacterium]|nr:VOC family protein [Alphaproteobacteria bacterium]
MDLAKQHLDIGLYTNQREEQLAFWQGRIGLEFDHLGKLGGGVHQLRHHMNGSILKINHARGPLPDLAPSGYRRLLIARPGLEAVQSLADPD